MPYVVTNYSWTTDANHPNLTGEQREVHHMYQGYKIEVNEKGEYANAFFFEDKNNDKFTS